VWGPLTSRCFCGFTAQMLNALKNLIVGPSTQWVPYERFGGPVMMRPIGWFKREYREMTSEERAEWDDRLRAM
jgi:hypothetical protein